jgi:hypothetical protein
MINHLFEVQKFDKKGLKFSDFKIEDQFYECVRKKEPKL